MADSKSKQTKMEFEAEWLGREFLTWLWFEIERRDTLNLHGQQFTVGDLKFGVEMTTKLMLQSAGTLCDQVEVKSDAPCNVDAARTALRMGHKVAKCHLALHTSTGWDFEVTVDSQLALTNGKMPKQWDLSEKTNKADADFLVSSRLEQLTTLQEMVFGLFECWIHHRVDPIRWPATADAMREWVREGVIGELAEARDLDIGNHCTWTIAMADGFDAAAMRSWTARREARLNARNTMTIKDAAGQAVMVLDSADAAASKNGVTGVTLKLVDSNTGEVRRQVTLGEVPPSNRELVDEIPGEEIADAGALADKAGWVALIMGVSEVQRAMGWSFFRANNALSVLLKAMSIAPESTRKKLRDGALGFLNGGLEGSGWRVDSQFFVLAELVGDSDPRNDPGEGCTPDALKRRRAIKDLALQINRDSANVVRASLAVLALDGFVLRDSNGRWFATAAGQSALLKRNL